MSCCCVSERPSQLVTPNEAKKKPLDSRYYGIVANSDGGLRSPFALSGYAVAPALRDPKACGAQAAGSRRAKGKRQRQGRSSQILSGGEVSSMGTCRQFRFAVCLCVAALLWLLSPPPVAGAEGIAVITNERGEKVYVNNPANGPVERHNSLGTCLAGSCTGENPKASTSPATSHYAPTPLPVPAARTTFGDLIDKTAARHHVDPQLVEAIVQVESDGNPHALSSKGAQGLMQLIPATAERLGVEDPYDPRQNVEGGVSYLRYLLDRFGGDTSLALAGYNAGENSVLRSGGVPPFKETQAYVRKVNELYGAGGALTRSSAPAPATTPAAPPIYRYIDGQGVLHYTNE
jgi:hypothetical protein